MLTLAGPIVFSELGWMTMGLVDTMMVGRVSPEAIGAVGVGGMWFYTIAIVGSGVLLGLDTLVSQSFGAGDIADCHRSLFNGIYLSLLLAPFLMGLAWLGIPVLRSLGINPRVLGQAIPYVRALAWSMLPLLIFFACRRYMQGMNVVRPVMFTLFSANLVNLAGNWIFVYGNFGIRALGAEGSAWATCISRVYMAAVLLTWIARHDREYGTGLWRGSWLPDAARMRRLLELGIPAGMQLFFEVAVFAAATAFIARLDAASLAGHQIAMNAASLTYMVPLGIGSAAAVRVGQALGRDELRAAARSGWTAISLGAGFMTGSALVFLLLPRFIVRAFSIDPRVMRMGVTLLAIAAIFQLFDGVQAVATGALRGAGQTRIPMLCHMLAYWVIGLPVGYTLAFRFGWGAAGLWVGLCVGLILIGSVLMTVWIRKSSEWISGKPAADR